MKKYYPVLLVFLLLLVCACDYIPMDIGLLPSQATPIPAPQDVKDAERVFSGMGTTLYPMGANVYAAITNLYAAPDASSEIITQLETGAAVTIIAASGEWYEVKYQILSGYAKIEALRAVEGEKPRANKDGVGSLVNIRMYNPTIQTNLLLAREGSWGAPIYTANVCALTKRAADRLGDAQKELSRLGKGLKILDAYRDEQAQARLLARTVGHVEINRGATHRAGSSVDVTLVDSGGRELPMPSRPYGESVRGAEPSASDNARILKEAMQKHGFVGDTEAWWHFEEDNASAMPLLDVTLADFLP